MSKMNDEMVVIKRGTAKFPIRKEEYEALKELKKTNPLSLNIDHVLSFARVKEGGCGG